MTSSNGNIFRVTGLLWGEFTGHRWIPLTKASDAELWCFLWFAPEHTVEQTIETLVIWDIMALIMTSPWCHVSKNCPCKQWYNIWFSLQAQMKSRHWTWWRPSQELLHQRLPRIWSLNVRPHCIKMTTFWPTCKHVSKIMNTYLSFCEEQYSCIALNTQKWHYYLFTKTIL